MDQDLASTMDAVDAVLGKDTFVLYSTDHGTQWPFGKWNLYDTGTRVPMVVRWNGHVKAGTRSEEHTSELQSLMRISYAVLCLKKKKTTLTQPTHETQIKYLNRAN